MTGDVFWIFPIGSNRRVAFCLMRPWPSLLLLMWGCGWGVGVVVVLPAVSLLAYRGQHAGLCLCVSFGKWPAVLSSEPMFSFSLEDFVWSV